MTKRIGIIGYPLSHTLSPVFHQAGLDHVGFDAKFEAWPTPPSELEIIVESFRDSNCIGACVTLPYKQAVISLLDELDESANTIGAVNWIRNCDGKLIGHNTDAPGFIRALREELGVNPEGMSAVIFGAGGVARAIAFALRGAKVKQLVIANRSILKAQALAANVRKNRFRPDAIGLSKNELADVVPYSNLLINGTSMGMAGGPAPSNSPVSADIVANTAFGYDAVYAPSVTPFMDEIEKAGGRAAAGLSMLVYQGVIGFELCTGIPAPTKVMMEAIVSASR